MHVNDFFFSSRRRHTRFDCDWSSDVCSSDLDLETVLDDAKAATTELPLVLYAERGAPAKWKAALKLLAPGYPAGHKDRKSTRLNSSHSQISYAVFCLKKKKLQLLTHSYPVPR